MDNNTKKKILNRLNRAEGQIKALKKSIASDTVEDCRKFLTQVKAVRSALQGVSEDFVLSHIHSCEKLPGKERNKKIDDVVKLVTRF